MKKFYVIITALCVFCLTSCDLLLGSLANAADEATGSVIIYPTGDLYVTVGETLTLSARTFTSTGTELKRKYTWYISDENLGTFSDNVFTANKTGVGTVTVENETGIKATAKINVVAPSVVIYPTGDLCVTVGETLTLSARTFTLTGKELNRTYTWYISDKNLGTFSDNVFKAINVGVGTVTVENETGIKATAKINVVARSEKYVDELFTYNNKVYYGAKDGTGGVRSDNDKISVTFPLYSTFEADGFFRIKGTVTNEKNYNYAYINVKKNGTNYESQYFVRNNYDTRIWLRFGAGDYTISVCEVFELKVYCNGEGWINSWKYTIFDTYNVKNTRDEDGQYLYPSYMCQSDDEEIAVQVARLTQGKTTDADKIRALHDYITDRVDYDNASLTLENRKKQDAVSTLTNRLGVCEGYADLTAAMLRCAGIKTKVISGEAFTGGKWGNHAWNNVLRNGTWYLLDTTWTDSLNNSRYYMISSLKGINGDHKADNPQDNSYSGRGDSQMYDEFTLFGQ